MVTERRRAPRANVKLRASWEGASTWYDVTITSLSVNGCFILSGGNVEPGEAVRLEIVFPDETRIRPWAAVVEVAAEIGFAVRFTSMEGNEKKRLQDFVKQALMSSAAPGLNKTKE